MSIRERIDDGRALAANDRMDGAVLMTLVAVAATARKRYRTGSRRPDGSKRTDATSFQDFLADILPGITGAGVFNIAFQGRSYRCEELLYKYARCHLVHEGEVGPKLAFERGDYLIDKKGTTDCIWFSSEFIGRIAEAVSCAPENKDLFPEFWPQTD